MKTVVPFDAVMLRPEHGRLLVQLLQAGEVVSTQEITVPEMVPFPWLGVLTVNNIGGFFDPDRVGYNLAEPHR